MAVVYFQQVGGDALAIKFIQQFYDKRDLFLDGAVENMTLIAIQELLWTEVADGLVEGLDKADFLEGM